MKGSEVDKEFKENEREKGRGSERKGSRGEGKVKGEKREEGSGGGGKWGLFSKKMFGSFGNRDAEGDVEMADV